MQRQPGTNTMEVAQRVKEKLAEIEKGLPPTLGVGASTIAPMSIGHAPWTDVKLSLRSWRSCSWWW